MARKRRNGEGSYGEKTIKGVKYKYFRSPEGKYFYGKTSKELDAKVNAHKNDINTKEYYEFNLDGKLTLGEYSEHWLEGKKSSIKPKTYDGYESIINIIQNKKLMICDMQISAINKKRVQKLFDDMADSYARSTITKTRALLNQIFDEAIENDLLSNNPVYKTKVPIEERVAKDTKEIIILEEDDLDAFSKEANKVFKNGKPYYGVTAQAALFILETGLRAGELEALKWDNVDIEKKEIYIREATSYVKSRNNQDKKFVQQTTSPKTRSGTRTVPLSNKAIEILEWCKQNKQNDYVFTTKDGNQILTSNLDKTIKRIAKNANLQNQDISAHPLRHTFASRLLSEGIDISVVSKILGHSKTSTTYDIYIHVLKDKEAEAINKVFNKK